MEAATTMEAVVEIAMGRVENIILFHFCSAKKLKPNPIRPTLAKDQVIISILQVVRYVQITIAVDLRG